MRAACTLAIFFALLTIANPIRSQTTEVETKVITAAGAVDSLDWSPTSDVIAVQTKPGEAAKDGIRAPKSAEGWAICPFGYGDLDLARFVRDSRIDRANTWWSSEQDNADGGDADPQKALRDIASGYHGLASLGEAGGVGAPFAGAPARRT